MINGEYLKAIRKERGITLAVLSRETGCTASYLSQIERRLKEPSLPMLRKLSETLNIPMVSLLSSVNDNQQPSKNSFFQVTLAGQRNVVILPELETKSEIFTPINSSCSMKGTIYTTPPGKYSSEGMINHTYDECIFVLSGQTTVFIESEAVSLKGGDSIYIYAAAKHNFYNCGQDDLVILAFSDSRIRQ